MILVLLGTHELPFRRLVIEIERLKIEGIITEEVIVQNGNTKFKSNVLELKKFVSYEEMDELFEKARLIVTHSGTGSIISGLKKGKKIIAVPRLKQYGEHNDDHQLEIAKVFEEAGHILIWNDGEKLEKVIEKSQDFIPNPFKSQKKKMLTLLRDFIENV